MLSNKPNSISDDFSVRKSNKAKRVVLRVHPRGHGFELVVPKRVSMKYALEFAESQRGWMEKQKAAMTDIIPMLKSEANALKKEARKVLTAMTMEKIRLLPERKKLKPLSPLQGLFEFIAPTPSWERDIKIRIGDPQTQWGSCHPDGRISYSWRLMLAPEVARDYIVAHEVAHLVHNNHGKGFWQLCKQLSADFEAGHGWIKNEGKSLQRYVVSE